MKLLVNIDVPDLDAARSFYAAAFGLQVGRRFGDAGIELLGANADLYLLRKAGGSAAVGSSSRDYQRHWTPIHCDIVVDDLQGALAQALSAGALAEGEVREHSWGNIVQLADPFGHGWCLLQFRGGGYDEITT